MSPNGPKHTTLEPEDWLPLSERTQTYWTTKVFTQWYDSIHSAANTDDDDHLTFREVLPALGYGPKNVDLIVSIYGETFDWIDAGAETFGLLFSQIYYYDMIN